MPTTAVYDDNYRVFVSFTALRFVVLLDILVIGCDVLVFVDGMLSSFMKTMAHMSSADVFLVV